MSFAEFTYWRLSSGAEVDFIVNDLECAIEVKASESVHDGHLKGLRELRKDHPQAARLLLVCREPVPRKTSDGIEILPWADFLDRLWMGEFFGP